jgi:hypothetical protein
MEGEWTTTHRGEQRHKNRRELVHIVRSVPAAFPLPVLHLPVYYLYLSCIYLRYNSMYVTITCYLYLLPVPVSSVACVAVQGVPGRGLHGASPAVPAAVPAGGGGERLPLCHHVELAHPASVRTYRRPRLCRRRHRRPPPCHPSYHRPRRLHRVSALPILHNQVQNMCVAPAKQKTNAFASGG